MHFTKVGVVLLALGQFACSGGTGAELDWTSDADIALTDTESSEQALAGAQYFYSARPDFRKCMYPRCGGIFVKRGNYALTRCADGVYRNECYVAVTDLSALGLSTTEADELRNELGAGHALVRGQVVTHLVPQFGNVGKLVGTEGWKAATQALPTGSFFRAKDNGMRCITYPCFSYDVEVLNSALKGTVSEVSLGAVGADADTNQRALEDLWSDSILVAGTRKTVPNAGPAGTGRTLVASQFYLKVRSNPVDPNFCVADSGCTLSTFIQPVTSKNDCYCPMCPVVMGAAAAAANEAGWMQHCAAQTGCPVPKCMNPGTPVCRQDQCVAQ